MLKNPLDFWHVKIKDFHGAHDFRRGPPPFRVGSQESLILADIRKSQISDYTKSEISSHIANLRFVTKTVGFHGNHRIRGGIEIG